MAKKRIFLAGASGFLGSAIFKELIQSGHEVTGLARQPKRSDGAARFVQGEITNADQMAKLLDGYEVVINAAGKTGNAQPFTDRHEFFRVNADAVTSLAKAARHAGATHFIQVSSTGVFGRGEGEYHEASPCHPINIYEESKYAGESQALAEASREMEVTVIRPSNVFGEMHPWNKLLTWLRAVKKGRAVLFRPPDAHWVNYVYVGDVAHSIADFVVCHPVRQDKEHNVYIVNTSTTVQEFFEASVYGLGVSSQPVIVPKWALTPFAMVLDRVSNIVGRPFPLTMEKIKELSSHQIFVAEKLKIKQPQFPHFGLREGLRNLCVYYNSQGLL